MQKGFFQIVEKDLLHMFDHIDVQSKRDFLKMILGE